MRWFQCLRSVKRWKQRIPPILEHVQDCSGMASQDKWSLSCCVCWDDLGMSSQGAQDGSKTNRMDGGLPLSVQLIYRSLISDRWYTTGIIGTRMRRQFISFRGVWYNIWCRYQKVSKLMIIFPPQILIFEEQKAAAAEWIHREPNREAFLKRKRPPVRRRKITK